MDNETLDLFLQLLDDSQLVAHINKCSQAASQNGAIPSNGQPQPQLQSHPQTQSQAQLQAQPQSQPILANAIPSIISSFGSDPFNDDLDSVLLKLDASEPPNPIQKSSLLLQPILQNDPESSSYEVFGNQLAVVGMNNELNLDTDDDSDIDSKINKDMSPLHPGGPAVTTIDQDLLNIMAASSFHDSERLEELKGDNENSLKDLQQIKSTQTSPLNSGQINKLEELNGSREEEEEEEEDADKSNFGQVGAQHQFGDFNAYFENKHRKQQLADQYFVEWEKRRRRANGESSQIPPIFKNCIIFVNGNTIPSITVIHKAVVLHGGQFLHYLSNKGAATHIICDKLTPRKRIEYRNYKVVRAKWISDSVDKQQLMDWTEYRLIDDVDYDQQRLGFEKVKSTVDTGLKKVLFMDIDQKKTDIVDTVSPLEADDGLEGQNVLDEILDDDMLVSGDPEEFELDLERDIEHDLGTDLQLDLDSDFKHDLDNNLELKVQNEDPSSKKLSQFQVSRPRQAFAQMDAKHPDFLTHFFANSRLHHLSTWKADLRSKFIRLVANGIKTPPKNPNALRLILHIDFDCFFATVSALKHSNLDIHKDPIAVSHGGKSSDVASCNYVARAKGVRNGLWLGGAMQLCPELKVIDYDFNAYEKVSHAFYTYLITCGVFDLIFPVLIDEVLVDASSHCSNTEISVENFLQKIRDDVFLLTKCSVSVGAAENVVLAKLAIRRAKPNGQFYLHKNIDNFLAEVNLQSLPGMGYGLCRKLSEEADLPAPTSIFIKDIKGFTATKLTKILGDVTGQKLFNFCRGIDNSSIELDTTSSETLLGRKSVSVEVNYGIRFDTFNQVENFLMKIAKELQDRMISLGVCGSRLSLKLARRQPNSPVNPPKYMGMGKVDFFSKSSNLGVPTNDWGLVGSEIKALHRQLNIPPEELRGIGVTMAKLVDIEAVRKEQQQKLRFNQRSHVKPVLTIQSSQAFPFAEKVVNSDSIDWDVFNHLPDSIKREFKKELLRRGIPVSSKEKSPSKNDGRKVFHQQLFPSQPYGKFKSVRVIESPKKKRKIRGSPTKVSTVKEESPTPYNETISYDEEVLNEIPSSIRNEFIAECERQQKMKKLTFVSMREKLEVKDQHRRDLEENVIDSDWLRAQTRLISPPRFSGLTDDYSELVRQLQDWIKQSLPEQGPHPDDFKLIESYVREAAQKGLIVRAVNLIRLIAKQVETESIKLKMCLVDNVLDIQRGIDEWEIIISRLKKLIREICFEKNFVVDFD